MLSRRLSLPLLLLRGLAEADGARQLFTSGSAVWLHSMSGSRAVTSTLPPVSPWWAPRALVSMVAADLESATAQMSRTRVRSLLREGDGMIGQMVEVSGWVRTVRKQKAFAFIEVNDGSALQGLQVVAPDEIETYGVVEQLSTGAAVTLRGEVVVSPAKGQAVEVRAQSLQLVGECPAAEYPLQKKRHTLEFLRSIAHLRPRTNTIGAVARVRSALSFATHQFFSTRGFQHVHTPLITASDCEGAGEMFRVTTLPVEPAPSKSKADEKADALADDFFGRAAYLTVSGQLCAETYACALGDVYTFGPTFRAEDSNTARHLAEFWMIEPEMAFCDLQGDMDNAEAFVKHVVEYALLHCEDDLRLFSKFYEKQLFDKLKKIVEKPFARVSYSDAVRMLQKEIGKDPSKWEYPDVEFGTDLATEHERWLAEVAFNSAVFVYDYPKAIKAFYMRDNDDGQTVAAMDLLVPGVGELIGGSQREERLPKLLEKMEEAGLDPKDYWWYVDLRRYGSVPHSGYGLGFERLVCYVTGVANIRDAIPFPRYPGSCDF